MEPYEIIIENSAQKSYDIKKAAKELVDFLIKKGETVSTAESCTGGLIGGAITSVAGASSVFNCGFITYANSAKHELLGVKAQTLESFGAVSVQTAMEMAIGAASAAKSELGIAVTGIAGPGGGTPEKPVGLVYIGINHEETVRVYECHFTGDREQVRSATVYTALCLAYKTIS